MFQIFLSRRGKKKAANLCGVSALAGALEDLCKTSCFFLLDIRHVVLRNRPVPLRTKVRR